MLSFEPKFEKVFVDIVRGSPFGRTMPKSDEEFFARLSAAKLDGSIARSNVMKALGLAAILSRASLCWLLKNYGRELTPKEKEDLLALTAGVNRTLARSVYPERVLKHSPG